METSVEVKAIQPSKLIDAVLDLERIELNLYRAKDHWKEFNSKQLYGGQVVCQGMVAASRTLRPELHINSLHCYFIHKGNKNIPVVYQVENLRDGKSFSTRSVHAIQEGKTILIMILSFHIREESPYHHQYPMPKVPFPEELLSVNELIDKHFSDATKEVKAKIRHLDGSGLLLEYRHIDVEKFLHMHTENKPQRMMWVRVQGRLGVDDSNENIHRCAAAFISDSFLSWTAYLPHYNTRLGMLTSLDHSMWFHAPFRADEWMLYKMESPQSGAARGMTSGRLWRRDGTLAASFAQECLMRPYERTPLSHL